MTKVFLEFNLELICFENELMSFRFRCIPLFFKSPASKHRVRDDILHGLVVHMVPYQKSVSKIGLP